jgi:hypothetical protein
MIKPEFGSDRKRLSTSPALDGRQKNLLFHTDMPKEPCTELGVGAIIDCTGVRHRRL